MPWTDPNANFSDEFMEKLSSQSMDERCRAIWNDNIVKDNDSVRHLLACIASHVRAISQMHGIEWLEDRGPTALSELNDISIDLEKILERLRLQDVAEKEWYDYQVEIGEIRP